MTKMNFSLQSSLEANYLNVQVPGEARLDEIAIRVIKEDCPDFLIPFRIVNINNRLSFKYRLMHTVALAYFDQMLQKEEFVRMYLNLLTPFIKGRDWFLDYHNLCIDPHYVFLDRMTGQAFFLYIPERSAQNSDEEILQFFKDTFGNSLIGGDSAFQVRLFQYFAKNQVTLNGLYQIFLEESRRAGTGGDKNKSRLAWTAGDGGTGGMAEGNGADQRKNSMAWTARDTGTGAGREAERQGSAEAETADKDSSSLSGFFGQRASSSSGISGAGEGGAKAAEISGTGKESGIGKLGSLVFGGGKGKKGKGAPSDGEGSKAAVLPSGLGEEDEVIAALFGESGKEQKKGRKEKMSARVTKEAGKAEKKKAGGFLPFGKKKGPGPEEEAVLSDGIRPSVFGEYDAGMPAETVPQKKPAEIFLEADGAEGDQTEIAGEMTPEDSAFLELIDSPIAGAPFRIELDFDKSYITVGRSSSDEVQPDVAFNGEFRRIGRRHARIERREGRYYVIDLGSANHTLLDGQILIPNQPYALKEGGELTFTDSRPVRYRIHL